MRGDLNHCVSQRRLPGAAYLTGRNSMIRTFMIAAASAAVLTLSPMTFAQQHGESGIPVQGVYREFKDLKWEKTNPEIGARSPEVAILYVDPKTQATHLLIRNPKNFVVPRHWHTANEAHGHQ